ncbi:hypothetical protein [Moorena bouillonii]|nr:hypothetical protein [Moorena bouillonii]
MQRGLGGFPHSRFASRHSLVQMSLLDNITLPTLLELVFFLHPSP